MSTLATLVAILIMYIAAPYLVSLFNDDSEVIMHGTKMSRIIATSFFFLNLSHLFNGANRAAHNVNAPMIIAIISQCVLKYLFVYLGLKANYSAEVLYYGSAVGFSFAGIFATIYFYFSKKTKDLHLR